MSRKKNIDVIAPILAQLQGIDEGEARRQLARESARKLRLRRKVLEWVINPVRDPDFPRLIDEFEEMNRQAGQMFAAIGSTNSSAPPTVHG